MSLKSHSFILSLILLIPLHSLQATFIDLEAHPHDFVLEVERIELPDHPTAFNPSIVQWQGRLLLSFREFIFPMSLSTGSLQGDAYSRIGLTWLDSNFRPIGKAQIISLIPEGALVHAPSRSEDARLVVVQGRLYIIYSDNRDPIVHDGGFRVYVGEVLYDETDGFTVHDIQRLATFEGESPHRREKNWVPFDYLGDLLLAYSLVPHKIFRPLPEQEECETFASSKQIIDWPWGELRGGTPGIPIDEDRYLAFFHSSIEMATVQSGGEIMLHYFMGAYTYSRSSPFCIREISPEPIYGRRFYNGTMYEPYWKPVRVIFPGGFIIDEHAIWIAYGRQDHEIWIAKLDRKKLLEGLVPISDSSSPQPAQQLPLEAEVLDTII